MKPVPPQIASLFERHAALGGFSVRGCDEIPDNCPRDADAELFVGDIDNSPALSADQHNEIFEEVVATLAELISEEPRAIETLRGRTFARVLH